MRLHWPHFLRCACLLGTAALPAQTRFKATIQAGETYIHPIGHGLYFSLDQQDGGAWNFQIKSSANSPKTSPDDYTQCLKSPFLHGPSTTDLTAWRFALGADAGWAEHVPSTTQISFVTNAADQRYQCAENDAMYDSFQKSQTKGANPNYTGLPHDKPRPQGHGRVIVTSVKLKPGLTGTDAEFEQITIEVQVTFPTPTKQKRP